MARDHGLPVSVFWGQRKPTARWRERDRLLALALRVHEDSLCKGCGEPLDESMDPANEHRYHTDLPVRCHACSAYERGREKVSEAKYPQPGALRLRLKPRESPPPT